MKKILILIIFLSLFSSCLNYIPCRGQDYIIEDITHQELISKFNDFREKYPEYKAFAPDSKNDYVPHYYIELIWKDLDLSISCDIHIGDQIANPPTHLNFTFITDSIGYKDINSKEIDENLNKMYKGKFETEILDRMGVTWKRESCW